MIKTITFIRHAKLAAPYDNYGKLSMSELKNLSENKISPSIDYNNFNLNSNGFNTSIFTSCQLILHSQSLRTSQTSNLIKSVLNLDIKIMETELLDEIKFDPFTISTITANGDSSLDSVRSNFYQGLIYVKMPEIIEGLEMKFKKLSTLINELDCQNLICVTHGFIMVLIKLYFDNKLKLNPNSIKKLDGHVDRFDFLNGFSIYIDN